MYLFTGFSPLQSCEFIKGRGCVWFIILFLVSVSIPATWEAFRKCVEYRNKWTLGKQMEKAMAPHSSTLVWKIPWTEEPGRLQSMGLRRVGHDWETSLSLSCIGEGNGNPLQCSCLENPKDGGVWWAAISGVAQSRTRLKWLSSNASIPSQCVSKTHWSLSVALSPDEATIICDLDSCPCPAGIPASIPSVLSSLLTEWPEQTLKNINHPM